MKRSSKFYAKMSLFCLIGIETLRSIDVVTHAKWFAEHFFFLLSVIAYMAIVFFVILLLLRTYKQGFLGCFVLSIFSLGFIALDIDLIPVLTGLLSPDIPLSLLLILSPPLSILLALFSYEGYKSLGTAAQEKFEVMEKQGRIVT